MGRKFTKHPPLLPAANSHDLWWEEKAHGNYPKTKNKGLTVKQLLLTCKIGEADWNRSKSEEEKKDIELVMTFSIVGFCISLRGEEVPLTVIDGRVAFLVETSAHIFPHIMITLKGKVKGKNNLRCHCILIADQTKSGIPTWRWISRMI